MLLLVLLMLLSSIRFLVALKTQCVLLLVLSSMFSWLFLLSSMVENKSVGVGVVDVVIYYWTSRRLAKSAGVRRVARSGRAIKHVSAIHAVALQRFCCVCKKKHYRLSSTCKDNARHEFSVAFCT